MKIRIKSFPEEYLSDDVKPVTSSQIYDSLTKKYHREGLFSEQIFGPEISYQCQCGAIRGKQFEGQVCPNCGVKIAHNFMRRLTYSYIQLPFKIPHPLALHFLFKKHKALKKEFERINYEKFDEVLELLENTDDPIVKALRDNNEIYTDKIVVIPPDLRPVLSKQMADDINKYYANILKILESKTVSATETLLKFNLTRLYYLLFEYIHDKVPKKEGLIRQALLGKETDFSARTVIVPDYSIPIDSVKVSKWILLDLLRPLIIHFLSFKEYNPTYINHLIDEAIKLKNTEGERAILDVGLELVLADQDRYAVFNRQPTLHRGSMLGFKILVDEDGTDVIKLNPLHLVLTNGDFDGDQYAMYLPLTKEAHDDAKDKMSFINNILPPGSMAFDHINQSVIYGLLNFTKDEPNTNSLWKTFDSLKQVYIDVSKNWHEYLKKHTYSVKVGDTITTVARLIVSYLLQLPNIVNKPITKKVLNEILSKKLLQHYIENKPFSFKKLEALIYLGILHSYDLTITYKDFMLDEDLLQLIHDTKQKLHKSLNEKQKITTSDIKHVKETFSKLAEQVMPKLHRNLYYMIASGAKGNKAQMMQMFIAKGFVTDVTNKIISRPIFHSLREGLTPQEFLIMAKAARKGSADRSIKTSAPGDLTRKLVFALNPVELGDIDDCGTNEGLKVTLTKDNWRLFIYRYIIFDDQTHLLTFDNYKQFLDKEVTVRSPIFCKSEKICKKCFGEYCKYLKSRYIGMIASQSLGERATQLTMRTFHTGGAAEVSEVELPTVVKENNKQLILEVDATISGDFKQGILGQATTLVIETDSDIYTVMLPAQSQVFVESGSKVKAGTAFASLPDKSSNIVGAIEYCKKLLETSYIKKQHWKDVYNSLQEMFGGLGILSIWYEILLSQIMRDPDTPHKPWRLGDRSKDPLMMSIIELPFLRPLLALAFQNIDKALTKIILQNEVDIEDYTILERIFMSRV